MDSKDRIDKYLGILSDSEDFRLANIKCTLPGGEDFNGVFQAVGDILYAYSNMQNNLNRQRGEIARLRDEKWKDKELEHMKERMETAIDNARRGFSITEAEEKAIKEWKEKHLQKKHPEALEGPGHFGAIGGKFTYEFIPTSIGTIGSIKCSCGEKFTFRDLG